MLDENITNLENIADAIIYMHRNNALLNPPPPGVANVGSNLQIDYGYNGQRYGSIEINRGQFQLSRVTTPGGVWIPLNSYNHAGKNISKQNFIDALKCNELNKTQTFVSALIILTAECCRSTMVLNAIMGLMNGGENFSDEVWNGLEFAFTNYSKTAAFRGYSITAGGVPWTSLRADDYIGYINSDQFTGDKQISQYIRAVQKYAN